MSMDAHCVTSSHSLTHTHTAPALAPTATATATRSQTIVSATGRKVMETQRATRTCGSKPIGLSTVDTIHSHTLE
jgi:hypothetical protein